jgi:Reverse transcriptase (RNA-dependent DNA polymerase)
MHLLKIMLKANGRYGVPQGGVISPLLSNIYLNEVDRMLERAKEVTRNGKYTYIEYARFADDMVILIDAFPRHDWLPAAVEKRLREELAALQVEINEEKSRTVDLSRGESFGFLGFGVLQRHKERRAAGNDHVSYSCVRDEGGPLGIGFQERVSNHSKRLRPKAVVVNVGAKARGMTPSRCVSGRRAKANPSMTRRKEAWRRQNQRREPPLGQVCRVPDDWTDGGRRIGGVNRTLAFMWNCRNQGPDGKGEAQAAHPRGESTDAEHWGGPTSRSDEGAVMVLEQRGRVRRSYDRNNWKQDDDDAYDRQTVQHHQDASVRGL